MIVKQNILNFLSIKKISKKDFYGIIGVSNGFLDKSGAINSTAIGNILKSYPEINPDWLITGEGSMYRAIDTVAISADKGIPLIPIEAMAGFATGDIQILDYQTSKYVIPDFDEAKVDYMIRVKGSSMYPKYSSGDIVACIKVELGAFFQWNKVYVLDTTQGAIVKRVKKSAQDNHILCISDNKDYDPFDLPLNELHNIALVVGVIRFE
jgi:repressor LexA